MTAGNGRLGPFAFLVDPITLQRLEGGMLLILSLLLFWKYSGAWLLYALLILAQTSSCLVTCAVIARGAAIYNLGHTWLLPGLIGIVGILAPASADVPIALIWFGHIGVDRLLGYGLKLPTAFQDTHLGRIGRNR